MSLNAAQAMVPIPQTEELDDLTRRGLALYNDRLKAILEPTHNNEFIAIEPDSEDYALANSSANAMRAMHKIHPRKSLLLMKIGPEPEYGLAARILAGKMMAGERKK